MAPTMMKIRISILSPDRPRISPAHAGTSNHKGASLRCQHYAANDAILPTIYCAAISSAADLWLKELPAIEDLRLKRIPGGETGSPPWPSRNESPQRRR